MEKIRPKIIRVSFEQLQLDAQNPRLPQRIKKDQDSLQKHMKMAYDLDELAISMTTNGYFEAEPLVVIPKDQELKEEQIGEYDALVRTPNKHTYIVIEGNRRLSTIRGLISGEFKYSITAELKRQFKELPVLCYPNRNSSISFLGVRQLAGVRKWNVYERARFIVGLKARGYSIDEIQSIVGDRRNNVKKTYCCYRLIEIVEDFDETFDATDAKNNFSFLLLATGQQPIREYIGLRPWRDVLDIENPIPQDRREKLKFLFMCLFDSSGRKSLIRESRDITNKLTQILGDPEAAKYLEDRQDINTAFDMIGGELQLLNKSATRAKKALEVMNGGLPPLLRNERAKEQDAFSDLVATIQDAKSILDDIDQKL